MSRSLHDPSPRAPVASVGAFHVKHPTLVPIWRLPWGQLCGHCVRRSTATIPGRCPHSLAEERGAPRSIPAGRHSNGTATTPSPKLQGASERRGHRDSRHRSRASPLAMTCGCNHEAEARRGRSARSAGIVDRAGGAPCRLGMPRPPLVRSTPGTVWRDARGSPDHRPGFTRPRAHLVRWSEYGGGLAARTDLWASLAIERLRTGLTEVGADSAGQWWVANFGRGCDRPCGDAERASVPDQAR